MNKNFLLIHLQVYRHGRKFAMFFMVLDLRLVKIGCRETINFFVPIRQLYQSTLE